MAPLWLRTLRFTVLLPGTVTVLVPGIIVALTRTADTWAVRGWRWVGLAPLVIGLGLYVWTAWSFATRGRGTPAPWDPPRKLVTTGPYAISRNPMYAAVVAVVVGEAMVLGSAWVGVYAVAVIGLFTERVIRYEEPALAGLFGEEYAAYRRRVRRWIGCRRKDRD